MTRSNVVALSVRNSTSPPIWVLFFPEDLRQHFLNTRDGAASVDIEDAIRNLEQVPMPMPMPSCSANDAAGKSGEVLETRIEYLLGANAPVARTGYPCPPPWSDALHPR